MTTDPAGAAFNDGSPIRPNRGVFRVALDLFSNVWFGVVLAALLFIYCSIGSGVPSVRQLPYLEMTEFEWFHWWPFNVLLALFCTTLITTTLRKIPPRLVNAGVWTIHAGIIVLCLGSYEYFLTKIEGDTPVFRRRVKIEHPELPAPAYLLGVPGAEASVHTGAGPWRFRVQDTQSEWPILTAPHEGEKAYALNVEVAPPGGETFIRQLLAGYPQYTEDVIPGKGRAIKSVGRKLLDESLSMSLDYEPQEHFQLMDSWALFVREVGTKEWRQRTLDGLPRYNDHVGSRDQVFVEPGEGLPLRSLDLPVPKPSSPDALGDGDVRVTGYLRYAHLERRWREGGDRVNPVLNLSVLSETAPTQSYELLAFDPRGSLAADGNVQFRWLSEPSKIDSLPTDSRAVLKITVPGSPATKEVPLLPRDFGGPLTPIEGTEFSYRVLDTHDSLALPGRDQTVSIAIVEISTPEGTFRRWVADDPRHTRDLQGESADPHAAAPQAPDPRVEMTYQPRSAPIIFAGHPNGLFVVFNGASGRVTGREIGVGDSVEIVPRVSVRVDGYTARAVPDTRPYVVPMASRQRNAGESFAMIRLELTGQAGPEARWLPFHQYVFPDEQYAYGGRFIHSPDRFLMPGGKIVEVVFSRERMELPHPIAMEDFVLDTHLGGYTGNASTIRNYISRLRFFDNGAWTEPVAIAVNNPTENGGFWYFQSTWDRPSQDDPGGGMNYTGLGVGNRHGVYVQLAGCCLAAAGMCFAFYVKPILKRRRAEQSRGRLTGHNETEQPETTAEFVAAV